ncbi:hypothetical protein F2P56_028257, partial [Juglans regia]
LSRTQPEHSTTTNFQWRGYPDRLSGGSSGKFQPCKCLYRNASMHVTEPIRRKKVQEMLNNVEASCKSGQAVDIGRAAFTAVLNAISNTFFSADLAQYGSNLSQEFQDLVCGIMEEVGRTNIVDYLPALGLLDPQGARRRTTNRFWKFFLYFGWHHQRTTTSAIKSLVRGI